jgi:hypothetical protein
MIVSILCYRCFSPQPTQSLEEDSDVNLLRIRSSAIHARQSRGLPGVLVTGGTETGKS